jgi:hypothetical protein
MTEGTRAKCEWCGRCQPKQGDILCYDCVKLEIWNAKGLTNVEVKTATETATVVLEAGVMPAPAGAPRLSLRKRPGVVGGGEHESDGALAGLRALRAQRSVSEQVVVWPS